MDFRHCFHHRPEDWIRDHVPARGKGAESWPDADERAGPAKWNGGGFGILNILATPLIVLEVKLIVDSPWQAGGEACETKMMCTF